jgi:hypothetical protein
MLYVRYGNALHIDFEVLVDHAIESFYIGVGFTNKDLIGVAGCASDLIINNKKERQRVRLSIPEILFTNGEYSLTFYIFQEESADVKGKRKFFATYCNWMKFYVTSEYTNDYAHFILKGTTKELNNAE